MRLFTPICDQEVYLLSSSSAEVHVWREILQILDKEEVMCEDCYYTIEVSLFIDQEHKIPLILK